jgi:opacity protein-like surface antigen
VTARALAVRALRTAIMIGTCAGALVSSSPTLALAQTATSGATAGGSPKGQAAKRASAPPLFRVAGFFEAGYQGLVAKDTFDATLGTTGGGIVGGGGSLTHRDGGFFQVDVTRFSAEGQRAFVYNGQVYPLGIPLNVELTPIEFTGGYKFFTRPPRPKVTPPPPPPPKPFFQPARPRSGEKRGTVPPRPAPSGPADQAAPASAPPAATSAKPRWGGVKPYLGGGMGVVQYKETSRFAASGENVEDSFTSYHALGGIEFPLWKWVGAAAEVNYRWVKDALGTGGLSKEFGEDDLGGPSFRFKVTVGR